MNRSFLYSTILLLLTSCNSEKQNASDELVPLHPGPKTVALNTEEGYTINPVTGDTIQPIINSLGDTIKTGVPVPARGRTIQPGSVGQPEKFPAGVPEVVPVNLNVQEIPENLTVIQVNKEHLEPSTPGIYASSFVLVNSTGDTIPTGVPIPIAGQVVSCLQPQPVKALPARMKDNTSIHMQYLDVNQGLNSPYVKSILEDNRGNLWFGTYGGGVSMFNGETFTNFTEKEGLESNYVFCILEDSRGNFWFSTEGGGVRMYDGETFTQYTETEGLSNNYVLSMLEDRQGFLWFGTWGGGVSRFNGETITHFTIKEGLSDNYICSILEDSHGNFWFGSNGGGVSMYNGETFTHFTEKKGLSNNIVWSILEDKHGNIWFGTNMGVSRYDGENFTHFTTKEGLSDNCIWSILEDSHGNLWFGTWEGGASMYNGETFTHFTTKEGLSNNMVLSIQEDSYGNLWFGTNGGGVGIYHGSTFKHLTENEGLGNSIVYSILEDKHGNLWFGTAEGGVSMYNGETFTHFTENEGLSDNYISSILEDSHGKLWFGTDDGGVSMYDGEIFTNFTKKEGLSNNYICSILEDNRGNLWFGTKGRGVSMYNGETFAKYTDKDGLSNNSVNSILEDSQGFLWFGTWGGGVSKYNGETFTHFTEKEGLSDNHIWSILEDSKGNLWFGTGDGGVNMFNGETFTHFTEKQGLSNNTILSILEDNNGNIWLSTLKGLNRLELSDISNPVIYTYGLQDGLTSMDFNPNSVLLDSKNRIWWGNGKSLTMLDMNNYKIPVEPPALQLNRIDINEQFTDFRQLKEGAGLKMKFDSVARFNNYPLNLELPYRHNHLTFHFSAIDWSAPHKIRYSFKMEGLNESWSNPTADAKADYRSLPHGTFTFKVRAIGEAKVWSKPFEYSFIILPPWYQTLWARAGYVILALLLVVAFLRWRTARLKQRQKELETEVTYATQEIRAQKEEVESQRDEIKIQRDLVVAQKQKINESITYAKHIQDSILMPEEEIKKQSATDLFIFNLPREIVSGDFYWFSMVNGSMVIAAIDCTGHGVPGAFMSMIGNTLLNDIVNGMCILKPSQILKYLNSGIKQALRQDLSGTHAQDGMDLALCTINLESRTLQYSGAKNPLYLIRDQQLEVIKADPWSIGGRIKRYGVDKKIEFTNHVISLGQSVAIYLFSDGYLDQFGGEKEEKFGIDRYNELLIEISEKPVEEQKVILARTMEEWKQDQRQIDDMLIIGMSF